MNLPQPRRVCFVIDRLGRAGTESQLLALIRGLDRSRVVPSLCLLNGEDEESSRLEPLDCAVIYLGLKGLFRPAVVAAALRLQAFLRTQRVEVVQTYFLDSTYFAIPLARLCGIRRTVRVRNNVGYWLTPRHRLLGRFLGRLATTTLTNSEEGRRALAASEHLPLRKIEVIENGVDLDRFAAFRPVDLGQAIVRVGVVANLRPVKNIDGLIRAAALLSASHSALQFEVAGTGEVRHTLQNQIDAAGLTARFLLRGAVENVPEFLARIDIAVLPSHSESMSNALLEYMAAGRAIVATDVGANARLVRADVDGLIVPPGDDAALAVAVERFLRAQTFAQQCGASARARAESEYSRPAMIRRFEDFFLRFTAVEG